MNEHWQEQLDHAMKLLGEGEIEKGLKALEQLRQTFTRDPLLQLQLAAVYHELGHHDTSLEILEQINQWKEELDTDTLIESAVYRASLYIDMDRLDEAMNLLIDLKEQEEDDYRIFALLGELFLLEGLQEVAIGYFEKALELEPDSEEIQYLIGKLYAEQGQNGLALEKWQELSGYEDDGQIVLERAHMAAKQGEFEQALELYEQAIELSNSPEAYYGYGVTAYQMGKWQHAVKRLAKLIELDAEYVAAYPILAESLWKLERKEQALAVYQRISELEFDDDTITRRYLSLLVELEKWETIQALTDRMRELDDEDPVAWYWKGRAAEGQRQELWRWNATRKPWPAGKRYTM